MVNTNVPSKEQEAEYRKRKCTFCGAQPGEPCMAVNPYSAHGKIVRERHPYSHKARREMRPPKEKKIVDADQQV